MVELTQFAEADFDPKTWINNACQQAAEGDMQRYLAELEMKLQLLSEDVDAALADSSSRALQRIPAAVQEVSRVKGDAASLKSDVRRLVAALAEAHEEAAASVATLARIDAVKGRMQAAHDTLREATELSALFLRVETVFAGGDVPAIADTLATMRRSLLLVGDVPEFKGGMQRLEVLEDRFQGLVEGSLASAFAKRRGEDVRQLVAMMVSIGRSGTVEKLYNAARLAPLQTFWDGFDPKAQSFREWAPAFYDEALAAAEAEIRWLAGLLPDQAAGLATGLMAALFARTDKSFRMRLSAALSQSTGNEKAGLPLRTLTQMQASAVDFAHALARALADAEQSDVIGVARAVYAPYEAQIARYGELEGRQLDGEMAAVPLPDAARDDIEAVVAGLGTSADAAATLANAAVERCNALTDGTEVAALLRCADEALVDYVGRLQAALHALRARVLDAPAGAATGGAQATAGPSPGGEAPAAEALQVSEENAAVLPLLNVAGGLSTKLGVLDATLRSAIADRGAATEAMLASDADPLHPARLRLTANDSRPLLRWRVFVSEAGDPRYQALPRALAGAAAFQSAVSKLVYDVLMIKVKEQLQGVAALPVWGQAAPANDFNLPAFSAYPLPHVTAAGEYLMMLPTLLESVLTRADADGESHVDGEWLDKVAAGAAELYTGQLAQIRALSGPGAQQLAADLEYFCNVLAALSVALPADLVTWQMGTSFSAAEFPEAAQQAVEHGGAHAPTMEAVARIRKLPWPRPQPPS